VYDVGCVNIQRAQQQSLIGLVFMVGRFAMDIISATDTSQISSVPLYRKDNNFNVAARG
jgi:hypothetical protein